jgi:alkanesulfonate monooxygenase SsuD/methylene tetrahydromethanopterin reductase-like flavin-dependent oxidoreductase (luciferase family)
MRNLLEEARLAEELGLELFAVGEHDRPDYLVSPATALAAIAAGKPDRLSSAVTVLPPTIRCASSSVRVDLISGGRAEIMAGRGSFIESFPLFGHELDYDELSKRTGAAPHDPDSKRVTTASIALRSRMAVWPRPVQDSLPIWVAVGGTPQSVVRAAQLGLPLTLAIIGGETARFRAFVDLYRRARTEAGHEGEPRIAINTHAFVADSEQAADTAFAGGYMELMNRIGRERGWPPSGRVEYEALKSPRGPLALGSPEQVVEKIVSVHDLFQPERYLAHMSIGAVPHREVMRAIELFGTEVAERVTAELRGRRRAESRRSFGDLRLRESGGRSVGRVTRSVASIAEPMHRRRSRSVDDRVGKCSQSRASIVLLVPEKGDIPECGR